MLTGAPFTRYEGTPVINCFQYSELRIFTNFTVNQLQHTASSDQSRGGPAFSVLGSEIRIIEGLSIPRTAKATTPTIATFLGPHEMTGASAGACFFFKLLASGDEAILILW
jgi:hypothetical protein